MDDFRWRKWVKVVIALDFILIFPSIILYFYALNLLSNTGSIHHTSLTIGGLCLIAAILHIFHIILSRTLIDSTATDNVHILLNSKRRCCLWCGFSIIYICCTITLGFILFFEEESLKDPYAKISVFSLLLISKIRIVCLFLVLLYIRELAREITYRQTSEEAEGEDKTGDDDGSQGHGAVGHGQLMNSFGRNKIATLRNTSTILMVVRSR